jgi:hypothetical protein
LIEVLKSFFCRIVNCEILALGWGEFWLVGRLDL